MEIMRILQKADLPESIALSEFAFQYALSPEDRAQRIDLMKPEQIWGYFVEGKLAAQLTLLDLHTWINGSSFRMGGIAGVATWPEHRRKGMVSRLLQKSLSEMKEQGQTISFLHPFAFPFYRRYGWETYVELKRYELNTSHIASIFPPYVGKVVRVPMDTQILQPVYNEYASQYNGTLVRDEHWWSKRFSRLIKNTTAVYYNVDGIARGYIVYEVKEKQFKIHEIIYLDEKSRGALWKFIADHDSMTDTITLHAPADDQLPFLLPNPRIKQEIVPYFMARIVDFIGFASLYTFEMLPDSKNETFYLQIQDDHASWNSGCYELVIASDGNPKIKRLEKEVIQDIEQLDLLSCNIQTITALLMGYQSAPNMNRWDRLHGTAAETARFGKRIPLRTTYLADFF